jgi:hypothetical protein
VNQLGVAVAQLCCFQLGIGTRRVGRLQHRMSIVCLFVSKVAATALFNMKLCSKVMYTRLKNRRLLFRSRQLGFRMLFKHASTFILFVFILSNWRDPTSAWARTAWLAVTWLVAGVAADADASFCSTCACSASRTRNLTSSTVTDSSAPSKALFQATKQSQYLN